MSEIIDDSGITQEDESKSTSKKTGYLPTSDNDILNLLDKVVAKWKTSSYTLDYITQAELEATTNIYRGSFTSRKSFGADRTPVSDEIAELDAIIDAHTKVLKGSILNEYGPSLAKSNYSRFGLVKFKSGYLFPKDRAGRITALNTATSAVEKTSFKDSKYGHTFYKDITYKYIDLDKKWAFHSSEISRTIAERTKAKELALKTLTSLLYVIRANNPDDYQLKYREWGFLKETY
jgi:hypothetical protein